MGAFTAELSGTTTVLRYWHPAGATRPDVTMQVRLAVDRRLAGAARLPYWYEFVEQLADPSVLEGVRPVPTIRVIAAPGVLVELESSFARVDLPRGGEDASTMIVRPRDRAEPTLEVIRVQDPELVPLIGDEARFSMLASYVEINAPSGATLFTALRFAAHNRFVVVNEPGGVSFHHLRSRLCLRIEVSSLLTDDDADGVAEPALSLLDEALDLLDPERVIERRRTRLADSRAAVSRARFGYAFEPEGDDGPLLRIVSTRQVRYALSDSSLARTMMGDDLAIGGSGGSAGPGPEARNSFVFEVYPNRDFDEIPLPGEPVPRPVDASSFPGVVRPSDELLGDLRRARDGAILFGELVVGQIPVVGYLYDWGAFAYGISYGRDFWGRPLSNLDVIVLGVAAILPVVDGAALREARSVTATLAELAPYAWLLAAGLHLLHASNGGATELDTPLLFATLFPVGMVRRAPRAYFALGQRADTVAELVDALREAERRGDLSDSFLSLLETSERVVRAGGNLNRVQLEELITGTRALLGSDARLPVQWLLNGNGTGFAHPELQRLFRASSSTDPLAWAMGRPGGSPARVLLESLLGAGYTSLREGEGLFRHGRRLYNFYYRFVPRPVALTTDRIDAAITILIGARARVLDRLGAITDALGNPSGAAYAWAAWRVGRGHFSILKGNIAEALSMGIQARILRAYLRRFPDAQLISGVMIRRPGAAADLLFSDNMVVRFTGETMEILGVVEIKAGAMGGTEATNQIHRWSQSLEAGTEIVLPAGTRSFSAVDPATSELASLSTSTTERRFVHGASGAASATVAGDAPAIAVAIANDSVVGNAVLNLGTARRHIITSAGASGQGMDSVRDVETIFERFELPFSSRELDYLAAAFLARIAAEAGVTP